MSKQEISWQDIAHRDPYLAGSIAAREWAWWDGSTAESQADSVGLSGERRADFLRGWNEELATQAAELLNQTSREYDVMAEGAEKGDPAMS